jgi:hypothetical protein
MSSLQETLHMNTQWTCTHALSSIWRLIFVNYQIQLNLVLCVSAKHIRYNLTLVHNGLLQPSLRIALICIFTFSTPVNFQMCGIFQKLYISLIQKKIIWMCFLSGEYLTRCMEVTWPLHSVLGVCNAKCFQTTEWKIFALRMTWHWKSSTACFKETQELNFGIYKFPVLLFHYEISPNTEYSVLTTVKLCQ